MLTPRENEIIDELFEDIFPEERDARANTLSPKGYDTSSELLRNPPSPQGEGLKKATVCTPHHRLRRSFPSRGSLREGERETGSRGQNAASGVAKRAYAVFPFKIGDN